MQKLHSYRFLKEFVAFDIREQGLITLDQDLGDLIWKLQGIVLHESLESDLKVLIFLQSRLFRIEIAIRVGLFIEYSNDAKDRVFFIY